MDDYGRDLAGTQALQRKQEDVEKDMMALYQQIQVLYRLATLAGFCQFHLSVCLFVPCSSQFNGNLHQTLHFTTISHATVSVYIVVKLGANICHVSGHCRKGFQGQRSRVRS